MKNQTTKNYKSTHHIKDEKFNVDDIGKYDLAVSFSQSNFKCEVVDQSLGRCVFFENFEFTIVMDLDGIISQCQLIFDEHHILKAGFWKSVRCLVSNDYFTLVPKELFDEKKSESLLNLHFPGSDKKSLTYKYFNPNSGPITSVYYVDTRIINFLEKIYPKIKIQYLHELSSILEGVLNSGTSATKQAISLFISQKNMHIVVLENSKLMFFNSFKIYNPQDAIYYLLSVLSQLNIDSSNCSVDVYGDVVEDSELIKLMTTYIAEVKLGTRPKLFYYNYEFDEIPEQWHFETFCSYLCK